MALIRQLQRLTLARIEVLLASLAAPEAAYPRLLAELSEKLQAAANAEAKARTAVAAAERRTARQSNAAPAADRLNQARQAFEQAAEAHRRLHSMVDYLANNRYRVLARARLCRARQLTGNRVTLSIPRPPRKLLDEVARQAPQPDEQE